jgi:hypothetical protein
MKELKITQDAVIKAAEQNKDLAGLLQTLFPDAFEEQEDDTLAIKKGVFNGAADDDLGRFCEKAFGDKYALQIANFSVSDNRKHRSLFVIQTYEVILSQGKDVGTIIEFHKR